MALTHEENLAAPPVFAQHALDLLPISRRYKVRPAPERDLACALSLTRKHLPNIAAGYDAALEVQRFSQSILAVYAEQNLVGSYAFLFLNALGLRELLNGRLSFARPRRIHLARPHEKAAALYAWAMCLPGMVVGAMGNIMESLRQPQYVGADLYGRPATEKGERFMVKTGFRILPATNGSEPLWVYRREPAL